MLIAFEFVLSFKFYLLIIFLLNIFFLFEFKGDSKPGSIIYSPRVVPKIEPNTNDVQSRNIWGQPSSSVPPQQQQQRISHPPPHCKGLISWIFLFISLCIISWNSWKLSLLTILMVSSQQRLTFCLSAVPKMPFCNNKSRRRQRRHHSSSSNKWQVQPWWIRLAAHKTLNRINRRKIKATSRQLLTPSTPIHNRWLRQQFQQHHQYKCHRMDTPQVRVDSQHSRSRSSSALVALRQLGPLADPILWRIRNRCSRQKRGPWTNLTVSWFFA